MKDAGLKASITKEEFRNELDVESLNRAMCNAGLYTFMYFPKEKTITISQVVCEVYQCRHFYADMPYSFAKDYVYTEDYNIFYELYDKIDHGEKSVTREFHNKNQSIKNRVTLTTISWDSLGNPVNVIGIIENVSETMTKEKVINTLVDSYYCNYYISLTDNSFEALKSEKNIDELVGKKGNVEEAFGKYIEKMVYVEDQFQVRTFLDMTTLRKRLEGKLYLECEYRSVSNHGLCRGKFLPVYMDNQKFDYVLFLVESIEQNRDILAEEMQEALGKQYFSNYYIDLQKMTFFVCYDKAKAYEIVGVKGDVLEAFQKYEKYLISENSREEMHQFLDLTTMQERLKNEDSISKEYLSLSQRWCRIKFLVVERNKDNTVRSILMTIESIDSIKRKEMENQKAVQEAWLAAEKANQAKTEFLSHMSHDIRTPLNAVLGMTDIALMKFDDKQKVQECLRKIKSSGSHLLSLIDDVLNISKIEDQSFALDISEFSLSDAMEDVYNMLIGEAEKKEQTLLFHLEQIRNHYVVGDKGRVMEIITNIVNNAIKYTEQNGRIEMTVKEIRDSNSLLCGYKFKIQDNGIGMPKEFLKNIFQPFARVEDSRKSKIQGTGLGMTITKNLVDMMDGSIRVESELGKGSLFIVSIPLSRTQNPLRNENRIMHIEKKENNYSNKRILLVDDQELNREIAYEFLTIIGVKVEEASNGEQAVEMVSKAEENFYDLIFMDIQMPVMDGYEATKRIRELNREDVKTIPIVAMTANAFLTDVSQTKNAGMNAHVAKPVDIDKIRTTLDNWIME